MINLAKKEFLWYAILNMYLKIGEHMPEDKNPSYSAKWLVRRLITRGISLSRIFRGTDLSEAWLKDENALIPKVYYMTIVNNALDESKDPALAFRLGRQPDCNFVQWCWNTSSAI